MPPIPTMTDQPTNEHLFQEALAHYREARRGAAEGLHESGVLAQLEGREHVVGFSQQSVKLLSEQLAILPSHESKACGAGCSFCCYQRIDVTPLEALAIAGALELTRTEEELSEIGERLAENAERVRLLTKAEHARAGVACAMLSEERSCSVYPVRPMACIGWHSLSRESCEAAFARGDPAERGVPLDLACLLKAKGFWHGLSDALARRQLDATRYELHSAVLCAINIPHAARRWLAGEPIFADCTPGQADAGTVMQISHGESAVACIDWQAASDQSDNFSIQLRPSEGGHCG